MNNRRRTDGGLGREEQTTQSVFDIAVAVVVVV